MSKLSNIITMIELLNNGKKYSIKELADILEVTPRMVRSYKEDLEKAGIYIDTIMGPYGGYVLNKSIKIPKRKFKKSDYQLLQKYIDLNGSDKKDLVLLQDKIKGIYFGSKNKQNELNEEENKKYNILARAIKEKRKVKISYFSYNKGENERIIHPYELFLFQNGWGCVSFCESKKDLRHFEVKRINKIELLNENYE